MRQASIIFSIIIICLTTKAQLKTKKDAIYLELGGNGIYGSINYERLVNAGNGDLTFRIGAGYYSGNQQFRMSLPIGVNYLFALQNKNSFIDFGIGATWASAPGLIKDSKTRIRDYNKYIVNFIPSLGWRTHVKSAYMFRASLTPIINNSRVIPSVGFSFGKLY
ncbi:MAG: hypothetical protein ABIQ31_05620 [Ferruginibacter sp.]